MSNDNESFLTDLADLGDVRVVGQALEWYGDAIIKLVALLQASPSAAIHHIGEELQSLVDKADDLGITDINDVLTIARDYGGDRDDFPALIVVMEGSTIWKDKRAFVNSCEDVWGLGEITRVTRPYVSIDYGGLFKRLSHDILTFWCELSDGRIFVAGK